MRWFQHVTTKAPEHLAEHNYKSASDSKKAPFAWVYDLGDVTFFEYLSREPRIGASFAGMMRVIGEQQPNWSDGQLYPVKEKLRSVSGPNNALIVDIGGGNGHDLEWFRKNHPEIQGRLILQDLPYITDKVKLEGIEVMTHNFYDEQPVKCGDLSYTDDIGDVANRYQALKSTSCTAPYHARLRR